MPQFILNTPPTRADYGRAVAYGYAKPQNPRRVHPYNDLSDFAKGYVEAMFFTNGDTGDERENLLNDWGVERLTRASVANIARDCAAFLSHIMPDGCFVQQWFERVSDKYTLDRAGNDFWFTRQGHGVGYWDREELKLDLWAPDKPEPGLGGWQVLEDSSDAAGYSFGGIFRDDMTKAAKSFGETYIEAYRGWIYHR